MPTTALRVLSAGLIIALTSCSGSPSASGPDATLQSVAVTPRFLELTLTDGSEYGLLLEGLCSNAGTPSCILPFLPVQAGPQHECSRVGEAQSVACMFDGGELAADADGSFHLRLTNPSGVLTMNGTFDRRTATLSYNLVVSGPCSCSLSETQRFPR